MLPNQTGERHQSLSFVPYTYNIVPISSHQCAYYLSHELRESGKNGQKVQNVMYIPSMRIELTTLGLLDPRSNQLSYEGFL